jgi:Rrf2 family protein
VIKLSRKVEYGLIALLHMDSAGSARLVTAKEVAENYGTPPELLGKVMQSLARAGLVESMQGARGGYRLTRPMEAMSVGDVIEALEGPIYLTPCCSGEEACRQEAACNIKLPVRRVQEVLQEFIYGLSLASFRGGGAVPPRAYRPRLQETGKEA